MRARRRQYRRLDRGLKAPRRAPRASAVQLSNGGDGARAKLLAAAPAIRDSHRSPEVVAWTLKNRPGSLTSCRGPHRWLILNYSKEPGWFLLDRCTRPKNSLT